MRRFEPVFLDHPLGGKVSQTLLRHFNDCERSGFLYHDTKGIVQTIEMVRGSCCHAIYQAATELMLERGETSIPPELVKVIVEEQLAQHPLPIEEHDFVREQAYRWADQTTIDPECVIACETLFVLEVGSFQVRAKVDFAELREALLVVHDYKTGKGAKSYEEISRKRSDGTISGTNFQLILYALAIVFGREVTVTVERCRDCEGPPLTADVELCATCGGSGWRREETIEPFPLAPRAQEVIASFVYPAIEDGSGMMLTRDVTLTRLELEEYLGSLRTIVARLERAERTGEWNAVISDAACEECACRAACPIPRELRDYAGEINTMEELQQACERYYLDKKRLEARRKEIKATAKALGGPTWRVRFGKDRVWELRDVQEGTTIEDKDAFFEAVELAVTEGVPFERSDFVRTTKQTPFKERRLSEEELAEEAAQREQEEAA